MYRKDSTGADLRNGASRFVRKACGLSLAVAMALGATTVAQAANVSTHHVRDAVRQGTALRMGSLPFDQMMNLDVVLQVRDPADLDAFVADVSNPASPSFRHYLTPAQFTAKFGPTQQDYDSVVQYLGAYGLTVIGGSRDGMDVQVSGSVAAIEAAFNVKMQTYQHPTENRTFFSPDREPTTALAIPLWHISGLDNFSIPHPLFVEGDDCAKAMATAMVRRMVPHPTPRPVRVRPPRSSAATCARPTTAVRRLPVPDRTSACSSIWEPTWPT